MMQWRKKESVGRYHKQSRKLFMQTEVVECASYRQLRTMMSGCVKVDEMTRVTMEIANRIYSTASTVHQRESDIEFVRIAKDLTVLASQLTSKSEISVARIVIDAKLNEFEDRLEYVMLPYMCGAQLFGKDMFRVKIGEA